MTITETPLTTFDMWACLEQNNDVLLEDQKKEKKRKSHWRPTTYNTWGRELLEGAWT